MLPVPRVIGSGASEMLLTFRSIWAFTVVLWASVLSDVSGSPWSAPMVALRVAVPPAVGVTTTVTVRELNALKSPLQLQVKVAPLPHVPLKLGVAETNVDAAGMVTLTNAFVAFDVDSL